MRKKASLKIQKYLFLQSSVVFTSTPLPNSASTVVGLGAVLRIELTFLALDTVLQQEAAGIVHKKGYFCFLFKIEI